MAQTIIAGISAGVAALSLLLALVQYLSVRRRKITDGERLALQTERLRSGSVAAHAAVQAADMIVQRSKDAAITTTELASLARTARGNLRGLAALLDAEVEGNRSTGDEVFISAPPAQFQPTPPDATQR